MLPFLCLLVLCGLLTQNVHGNANPLAIANLSPELLQQLLSQRMDSQALKDHLQSLPLQDLVKNGMQHGGGGGGFLSGIPLLGGLVDNVVAGVLGVKIKDVSLLRLDIKFDEHEKKIILTIPAELELEVKCPLSLMGRLLHIKVYLDIQVGVRIVKDPLTGHIKLTIENCQNNPGHLRITLLEKFSSLFILINKVVRLVTNILEKVLPHLLQKELCPIANGAVQMVMDVLQGSIASQMHGETFRLSPESVRLHDGSMSLAYGMPGGQSIPQDYSPLPSMPLEGSPMNMVLSEQYLASALQALLPRQVLNIGSQSEGTLFRQQIAAVLPQASHVQVLQIASGAPSLSLTVGKIQLWQPVEIRVYTEHPAGAYGPLFTIRVNLILPAHPSLANGKLIFALHSPRLENPVLVSSSIGNFDAHRLTGMMSRVVSAFLVPRQNKMLADGVPVPLVPNLDLNSVHIAAGNRALLLVAPPSAAQESA